MSNSMGTKEAAALCGYTPATISKWCREGKIKGAQQGAHGNPWHIPKDAECAKTIKRKTK